MDKKEKHRAPTRKKATSTTLSDPSRGFEIRSNSHSVHPPVT